MALYSSLELAVKTETGNRVLALAESTGALQYGKFTLASGKESLHYFDGKKLTSEGEGFHQVGMALLDELADTDIDAVGGLALGAFPIVTAVTAASYQRGKPIPWFIVREEAKTHGTRRKIEGHLREGSRVAIVDDVITTGGSVKKAIEAVEEVGCEVVKVVALVDRHEGGSAELIEEGYEFAAVLHLWPSGEVTLDESSTLPGDDSEGAVRRQPL